VSSAPERELETYLHNKANECIGIIQPLNIEKEIIPINPRLCNERIAIQQGLFLMSTDISKPFMEIFNYFLVLQNILRHQ